jgi:hypothetical protein
VLTEQEALELICKALAIHDAKRPVPSCVSVTEAAKMIGVSRRTLVRMNLPRNEAGKIPYEAVVAARAAR